jgi:hypothetical protein
MSTLRAFLALVALLLAAACEEYSANLWIEPQQKPFYWNQATKVFLVVDSTFLTVDADSTPVLATLKAWPGIGVTVDSARRSRLGLWLLFLRRGTSPQAAGAAAHTLRLEPDIRFASTGFRQRAGSTCGLTLLNRLLVTFQPSTSQAQIAALTANAGLSVIAPPGDTHLWWMLRYPVGSQYTPLEIAAALGRHPFVQSAEPDRYGCIGTLHG